MNSVSTLQVIVTVVEGRDLTAVQFFSLFELKRNAPSEDTLPSSWVKVCNPLCSPLDLLHSNYEAMLFSVS